MRKPQFSVRLLLLLPIVVPIAIGIGRWLLPVDRPPIDYWHEYEDIPALKVIDTTNGKLVHQFGHPFEIKPWHLKPGTYRIETVENSFSTTQHPGLQFMYSKSGPIRITELKTNRSYQLWSDKDTSIYKVKPGEYRIEIPRPNE